MAKYEALTGSAERVLNRAVTDCAVLIADVSVSCISFIRNTGQLAVGFNFGCFQLWKLSIPVLQYAIFH